MTPRRRGVAHTVCPACGRRTVVVTRRAGRDPGYRCVYRRGIDQCGWETVAAPEGDDVYGQAELARWQVVNPVSHR